MDRLSSCYFCGTALDEPLQDYPLVAGDTGEHGAVVTLCPGCHHKLETVLDIVVGEGEDLPALEDGDRVALEGESPAALTEPETGSGPDPIALGDGKQGDTDGAAPTDAETGAGGGAEPDVEPLAVDSTDAESGTDADGRTDEAAGGPRDADPDTPDADSATSDAAREAADDDSDGADGTGSPSPADGGNAATDSTATDAATAGDTAEGASGGTDPDREVTTTVSALEYNKVMRLLQNRAFPVDRAEIETVAASAYELSESECAAVIDLAVDRGLIAERDGQLVRPDE
jgi:hypothetical protein